MKIQRTINTVDSHTMGEPTRIVIGGVPKIDGNTMAEKKQYLIDNLDYVRTAIMHEPRGHNDMFGSIITAPCNQDADLGIIFMDGGGYLNMCGHGSIGAATVAVETGMVERVVPETIVKLDAPAGLIEARVKTDENHVEEVSFTNVPAFLYKKDVQLEMDGKMIKFDISFGGSFFAIVSAEQVGLDVNVANSQALKEFGIAFRDKINKEIKVQHPTLSHINTVDLVEIYDKPSNPEATYKNVVIFGEGQLDRSPCGTGTSAKLATLFAKGEIGIDEPFVYESITGTLFKGRVLDTTTVAEYNAVIPEITGSAFIVGFNQLIIDDNDPLKYGFSLG